MDIATLHILRRSWQFGSLAVCLGCVCGALAQEHSNPVGPIEDLLQRARRSEEASEFAAAEATLREALRQARSFGDKTHPTLLEVVHRLSALHYYMGEYESAASEMTEAVEISRALYGEQDEEYLASVGNLAALEHARGHFSDALRHSLAVAKATKERYGDSHPSYATALNNLAGVYQSLGDFQRSITNLQQVVNIRSQLTGEDYADLLTAQNNLAGVHLLVGEPAKAQGLLATVAAGRRKLLGPADPAYAASLNNLAAAEEALGKLGDAERDYREALRIREQTLGPKHPDVAGSLTNLAALLRKRGCVEQAEELLQRAIQIREAALGRWHPDYAVSLNNLAVHYRQCGRYQEAAEWYRRSLAVQHQIIEATLPALAEQQQITMLQEWRRTLDGFLSVAPVAGTPVEDVYRHVLWWKGRVQTRQLQRRHATDEHTASRLARLRAISGHLAALTLKPDASREAANQRLLQDLVEERERLESELGLSADRVKTRQAVSPHELAAALPDDAVLVDFLEYYCTVPAKELSAKEGTARQGIQASFQPQAEFVAFIVRRNHQIVRLNLGSAAAMRDLIDTWRRTCGAPGKGADAGQRLRELIWLPVANFTQQYPVVLVSPDSCLARLPLAALPGRHPGTFLLEERAFAVVPVPQLLMGTLNRPHSDRQETSLLLVGDIDYGTGTIGVNSDESTLRFAPLPAARSEILAVRDSFERAFPATDAVTVLRQAHASEARIRQECSRHPFIHIVTHGFVAESTPAPLAPGLSAGLALAGANEPGDDPLDDGILSAAEFADLDLRAAELVVLSACESGLGPIAAGEGVLGLQRACQMAGAKTVVASLWRVNDRATQQLMEMYYERVCATADPISRIEALRQAQLAMLRGGGQRGLGIVSRAPARATERRAPYEWAAFVLGGDWR